jgi:hypothetical protein
LLRGGLRRAAQPIARASPAATPLPDPRERASLVSTPQGGRERESARRGGVESEWPPRRAPVCRLIKRSPRHDGGELPPPLWGRVGERGSGLSMDRNPSPGSHLAMRRSRSFASAFFLKNGRRRRPMPLPQGERWHRACGSQSAENGPSSFRDARSAGPETITTIGSMDSGLAPRGAPRNDRA